MGLAWHIPVLEYVERMPHTVAIHDSCIAIAEPKRRELLDTPADSALTVDQVVGITGWKQPAVSRQLEELKQVGLVTAGKDGRLRACRINAASLKPVQEWVVQFEGHWSHKPDNPGKYLHRLQGQKGEKR